MNLKEFNAAAESKKDDTLSEIIKFNKYCNKFEYGLRKNGVLLRNTTSEDWDKHYKLVGPKQFVKQNGGVCWDWVTFEADYFKHNFSNIQFTTWYIVFDNKRSCPTHTFLTFQLNGKTYYFESAFCRFRGVYEGNLNDILDFVLHNMNKHHPKDEPNLLDHKYYIVKYNALDPSIIGANCEKFMQYCINQKWVSHKYNPNFKAPTKLNKRGR